MKQGNRLHNDRFDEHRDVEEIFNLLGDIIGFLAIIFFFALLWMLPIFIYMFFEWLF